MGKLLKQLFVALGQALWYRLTRRARPAVAPAADSGGAPLRIDLGCGTKKAVGFLGCDQHPFPGVDVVMDLTGRWPWHDNSVDEARLSHVLEHFSGVQRVQIFNEMYRVMKPRAVATIVTPYWCSNRAYGDFTHAWPPVSEMLYSYVSKPWRKAEAPDNDIEWNPAGYNCDFEVEIRYVLHPAFKDSDDTTRDKALTFYKEGAQDMVVRITARK